MHNNLVTRENSDSSVIEVPFWEHESQSSTEKIFFSIYLSILISEIK